MEKNTKYAERPFITMTDTEKTSTKFQKKASCSPRPTKIIETPRSMLPAGIAVYSIRTDAICLRQEALHYSPPESISALADSIHKYGIIHPLTVKATGEGRYTLVSGSRRLKAAKLLGLCTVPCLVITADDAKCSSISLCENFHTHEMHYVDVAEGISALCDKYGYSEAEAAGRLCVSPAYVREKLKLMALSEDERKKLKKSNIDEDTVMLLFKIDDARMRSYILSELLSEKLTREGAQKAVGLYLKKHRADLTQRHSTYLIRDVRIFYNSVERALDVMRRAGHNIRAEKKDMGDYTLLTVRIPNS